MVYSQRNFIYRIAEAGKRAKAYMDNVFSGRSKYHVTTAGIL
jgi:hypothetical protein